jgi:predicted transcriptional regulator
MDKKYTTADIARTLSVSERTVRRKLSKHLSLKDGKYEVSEEFFNFLKEKSNFSDNIRTSADSNVNDVEYDIVEGFSEQEYQEFQKRLIEYPLLKDHLATIMNQLEYFKESSASKDRQMELILENIQQRNFIEAKDKKID